MLTNLLNYFPFFFGLQYLVSSRSRWTSPSICSTLCKKVKVNKKNLVLPCSQDLAKHLHRITLICWIYNFSQIAKSPKEWDGRYYALVLLYPQPLKVFSSFFIPSQWTQTWWPWTQLFRWSVVIPWWRVEETWLTFQSTFSPFPHLDVLQRWKLSHCIQCKSKNTDDQDIWDLFTSAS